MVKWHELALEPTIRRLGTILAGEFGIWVGFIDPDGNQISIGAGPRESLLACQRFMANSIGGGETAFTCHGSLRRWAEHDALDERDDPFKRCHAGLGAITLPVHDPDGVVGSVYASGFFSAERGESLVKELRSKLSNNDLAHDGVLEEAVGSVPLLDRSQRSCALALVRAISREAELLLADAPERLEPVGDRYGEMIGTSSEMKSLFAMLRKISRGDSTVLVQGENGTGKELIARAIHRHSKRADAPFIVQNCAAIPSELIESELFGHKKGAFSGAHRDRRGLFEVADHGTFFLDEIGEMRPSLQVKLLRVLQEGTFLPVGDNVNRKVDVRIICATNRDLRKLVDEGRFREDLFYRINVITVDAPPLRHRREDIPLLATYFLNKSCHEHDRSRKVLTREATDALVSHPWPGNVRELENEMERAVILTGERTEIEADDLMFGMVSRADDPLGEIARENIQLPDAIEQLERRMILEGLLRTGWNKTQTARELGVSRRNLIRKVAAYELEKDRK